MNATVISRRWIKRPLPIWIKPAEIIRKSESWPGSIMSLESRKYNYKRIGKTYYSLYQDSYI